MSRGQVAALLAAISDVGTDKIHGGYSRHAFDRSDVDLRAWFTQEAQGRGLTVDTDRNGNLWAWWGNPGPNAVVTGSHLDSVPGGGAFDGPLGIAAAFTALDELRATMTQPRRPVAIVVFLEEEGGRFGVPCIGSRLMTGSIQPDAVRRLQGPDGVSFAQAMRFLRLEPTYLGRDEEALAKIGCFVELHVEQGHVLDKMNQPVGLASSILAHGRWRFTFTGQGNHAGTTEFVDRRDPMPAAAQLVLAAQAAARRHAGSRATVGRLRATPGGTNVIASTVDVWLDARVDTTPATRALVDEITSAARQAATAQRCTVTVCEESYGDAVVFDSAFRDELADVLGHPPVLPTGAGHDAGILAAHVPTAMLFVRNPTGVSHAPEEFAESDDCDAGAHALAGVLAHLAG
jgi:N-carbamoyl-L-amino-acid hydrolase